MSAEADDTLTKVDSAVGGVGGSPTADKKGHRRASSSATGVWNVADLGKLCCLIPLCSYACSHSEFASHN